MTKIYLHIGRPKTGSKSIQSFLAKNKEKLECMGILYPESGRLGDIHHPFFWSHWPNEDTPQRQQYIKDRQNIITKLHKEISNAGVHKVILSSEDAYIASSEEYATNIKESLTGFNVNIIVYIRRQDHLIESSYNQEVKLAANLVSEPFAKYKSRRNRLLDYSIALEPWIKVFGIENVIIRIFEKEHMPDGLLHDFLNILEIKNKEGFDFPEKPLNRPLVPEAVEIKRLINGMNLPNNITSKILPKLVEYSAAVIEKKGKEFLKHALLSAEDRKTILAEYQEANEKVAREYLGREDSKLFFEKMASNNDHKKEAETYDESLMRFIGYIIIAFEEDMQQIRQRLNNQQRRIAKLEESLSRLYK